MYLLYLDDSGSVENTKDKHCLLAGFSIYETKTHWIEQDINLIAQKFFPNFGIEFHGTSMRGGKGVWRGIPKTARIDAIKEVLTQIVTNKFGTIRLFCSVVPKNHASGIDIYEHMFTQVSSRFDMFLRRLYLKKNIPQRGIIIFDKNKSESKIQNLCHTFKITGHTWGKLTNLAEVPLFLDSANSRLIQLADLIDFSIFRYFEHNDDEFYSIIQNSFDSEGGVIHGLHVL